MRIVEPAAASIDIAIARRAREEGRPLGYFIASKHSFPKDLDRIATLIQRPNRMVLDLASGPGNVTRRLGRLMPDSTIVGVDLSSVMLGRAVRLDPIV